MVSIGLVLHSLQQHQPVRVVRLQPVPVRQLQQAQPQVPVQQPVPVQQQPVPVQQLVQRQQQPVPVQQQVPVRQPVRQQPVPVPVRQQQHKYGTNTFFITKRTILNRTK